MAKYILVIPHENLVIFQSSYNLAYIYNE